MARRLFDGVADTPRSDAAIRIAGATIASVDQQSGLGKEAGRVIEADTVAPGFIDLQINGANDVQFNDEPTFDAILRIQEGARKGGTACLLPTFITAPGQEYLKALSAVADAVAQGTPGILGVHLEGPFLSMERPGVHPKNCIRPMDETDLTAICEHRDFVRLLTIAPERAPPGSIGRLTKSGVTIFAGHSAATGGEMREAVSQGLRGATHLFNAMSQITVRDPGVVGSVLVSDTLMAGIIADGIHVHPDNLKLAARTMGDRLCLVSDAMLTLGGTQTSFWLNDRLIARVGNQLSDEEGRLAGAHLAMDQAVQNMVALAEVSEGHALRMASTLPAKAIGLGHQLGRIQPGFRAVMTLLDAELNAQGVVIDGTPHLD